MPRPADLAAGSRTAGRAAARRHGCRGSGQSAAELGQGAGGAFGDGAMASRRPILHQPHGQGQPGENEQGCPGQREGRNHSMTISLNPPSRH